MVVIRHALMGFRQVLPGEGFTEAGIKPALNHQLVRFRRLFEGCEMTALDAFLAHPHITGVKGEVVSGGASAEDDHAAALRHHAGDWERSFARMLKHHIDVITFAGDVPDGAAKAAAALHIGVEAVRIIHIWQSAPAIEIAAIDNADSAHAGHVLCFFIARDHSDWLGTDGSRQLQRKRAKPACCTPHQNMLAGAKLVWRMAEHHPISRCER